MEKHRGEIVERIVRKNNTSITQLARQLAVSRNKIYEWFEARDLSAEIILKVGRALDYDFSNEFPELIKETSKNIVVNQSVNLNNSKRVDIWKDKYIVMLERYRDLLS